MSTSQERRRVHAVEALASAKGIQLCVVSRRQREHIARTSHEQGSKRRADQDKNPDPTTEEIIVCQEFAPWAPEEIMAREKLKGEGHRDPRSSDQECFTRICRPNPADSQPCKAEDTRAQHDRADDVARVFAKLRR
jgi:hypothetical protein